MSPLLSKWVAVCWILVLMFAPSHQQYVPESDDVYDVIVIGAGASGVAALSRLYQGGLRVLGLEAEDRIGGRILTQDYGTGVVEFGAEWIHGNNIVHKLAKKNHVPIVITDLADFRNLFADGSEKACNFVCSTTLLYLAYVTEVMTSKPIVTVEEYIDEAYRALLSINPVHAAHRPYLDALTDCYKYLGYTEDGAGNWSLISTKGWTDYEKVDGQQNQYWGGGTGYHGLFDVLMKGKKGDPALDLDIRLNKEVVHVDWLLEDTTGPVSVRCADGSEYLASRVIITVSAGVLQARHESMFTPPLPASKVESINNLDMGRVVKMFLRYESNWWKEKRHLAFVWYEREDGERGRRMRDSLSEEDRWLETIFGALLPAGSDNVLTLWITGQYARFVETLPLETLKLKLDWLVSKFCGNQFPDFQDSLELRRSKWNTNLYFLGTYSYHGLSSDGIEDPTEGLREPITQSGTARLLFAGEATHRAHFSTVHGAVESGWREADRVLASNF